ncbi:MAG: GatB/YqeY domain-containing protein, partial [bacterium]|nr:GatB/YqeY domain-containing protein [bacterium]
LAIVQSYMPAAASDADMDAAIQAAITETGADSMKQMGLVMKAAKEKLAGKTVDGKTLSSKVKAKLG